MNYKKKIRGIKFRIYYLTIFKLKNLVRRSVAKILKFNRPNSFPYITGDGFRSLAQHIHDEISSFNPEDVREKDIVFVRADFLHTFFKKIHPKIQDNYILISHNSDQNIKENYIKYIDEKIIHWFCQNALFKHQKVTPIPIGLKLRMYDEQNEIIKLIEKNKSINKDLKIFYAFSQETNNKRKDILKELQLNTTCVGSTNFIPTEQYYESISKNQFVASPDGAGVDCHRTWETLYMNSIPILEKNHLTEYWYNIGLPVILIDDWKSISQFNIEFLKKIKEKFSNTPELKDAIFMDYWIREIMKYKK